MRGKIPRQIGGVLLFMTELHNQSWEVYNAAFHEGGLVQESMREQGKAILFEAHRQEKGALFVKLDEQNRQIEAAQRIKEVRTELEDLSGGQK